MVLDSVESMWRIKFRPMHLRYSSRLLADRELIAPTRKYYGGRRRIDHAEVNVNVLPGANAPRLR